MNDRYNRIGYNMEEKEEVSFYFEMNLNLCCILRKDGLLQDINAAFSSFTGISRQYLSGLSFHSLVHPDDRQIFRQLQDLEEGAVHLAGRFKSAEGGYLPVSWTARKEGEAYQLIGKLSAANKPSLAHAGLAVFDMMSEGVVELDSSGLVRYINKPAKVFLGKPELDNPGARFVPGWLSGAAAAEKMERAMSEGIATRLEARPVGTETWLEIRVLPLPQGLIILMLDITAQKKAELVLKEMNERYSLLSRATAGAIWEWDVAGGSIFYHGENFRDIFGYDIVNDCRPLAFLTEQVIHPGDRKQVFEEIQAVLEQRLASWVSECRLRKQDGSYANARLRGYTRLSEGRISSIIGCIEDITNHKLAQGALAETERQYGKLFNNAPLPQAIYDIDSLCFLKVNKAMISHYGYSREEFLSMSALDIRPQHEVPRVEKYIEHLKNAEDTVRGIWTHIKKSGEHIIVESLSTPIAYDGRRAVLVTMNDITEKLRLEEKVTRLKVSEQKKITRAQIKGQEKERLEIGRELHDNINQQLTTVKLYLDLARSDESLRLGLVERSERVLNSTINEIRSLSKSLISPTLHDVGLSEALQELVESYRIAGRFSLHFKPMREIDYLPEELRVTFFRILQEQLVNISRYAAAKNVWISFAIEQGLVRLTIRDDGKGFQPLAKRTGVGFANIKNRTELYNGSMHIESSPGNGCSLLVTIPLEDTMPDSMTVLIAEDDEDDQLLLREAFSEVAPHHRLNFASNGRQLVEHLDSLPESQLPSLIVLDYKMPVMGGLDTLKELQISRRYMHIPKIIYSTASNGGLRELCISANATAFLEKKAGFAEVKESIREMLSFCS
ncbi:MAG TPA: PAS domain S-box protein [Flavisolibacter sp.]|nr:PAS domain S-box protein [Flavisolibacter sp.]